MARNHPVLIHAVNMATILQLVQRPSAVQTEPLPSFGMTLGHATLAVSGHSRVERGFRTEPDAKAWLESEREKEAARAAKRDRPT